MGRSFCHAQYWQPSGSSILNSNTGDVVVGNTSNLKVHGQIQSVYPKSNSPLQGEYLGTSGWWGFRTDLSSTFHFDTYNNNSPKSVLSINQLGQVFFNARKSDLPLQGEVFGSSGWWGFRTGTNNAFYLDIYNNNTPKAAMSVDQYGNVGIGTTSLASARLHIVGSVWSNAARSNTVFNGNIQTDNVNFIGSEGYWALRTAANNSYNVDVFNGGSAKVAMTILQNGRVGIGTVEPDQALSVKGVIHTNEVRVDLNSPIEGPDYVFDPAYPLQPLAELESFIKKYRHLPEVPSANEMAASGLMLKEMNLLLLKKVEELTLHLIEQEKRIRILEQNKK